MEEPESRRRHRRWPPRVKRRGSGNAPPGPPGPRRRPAADGDDESAR